MAEMQNNFDGPIPRLPNEEFHRKVDNIWMVTEYDCEGCGEHFVSCHPGAEWLECSCGNWTQVPPFDGQATDEIIDGSEDII